MISQHLGSARIPAPALAVDVLLSLVREQLGMDVAFVARFEGARRHIRNIIDTVDLPGFGAGHVDDLDDTYCRAITSQGMDEVTPDARSSETARQLRDTRVFDVGAYIGIPLHRADGSLYGTLCAFSRRARPEIGAQQAEVLRAAGRLAMEVIESQDARLGQHDLTRDDIEGLLAAHGPWPVFQPIVHMADRKVVGHEALSRFPVGTPDPSRWFAAAADIGLQGQIEMAALERAVSHLDTMEGLMGLNISEVTLQMPAFAALAERLPLERIVLELTEHDLIRDYPRLQATLDPLRQRGLQVAVDDAGSGYASFQHVLILRPDFVKLDIALVHDIDRSDTRQALVSGLQAFASRTGLTLMAEGVETKAEVECLLSIGIEHGQGFYLGRPAPDGDDVPPTS